MFIGRIDAEVEAPRLWPPDAKSWLIGKDPDAGKDWGQEEKGATEDEVVGWHHQLNGHEFEQTLEDSEGQGSPCVAIHGVRKSQTRLSNWTTKIQERDFPGGPVIKTSPSKARGAGLIPGQESKVPQDLGPKKPHKTQVILQLIQ